MYRLDNMVNLRKICYKEGKYFTESDASVVENLRPIGDICILKTPLGEEKNINDIIELLYEKNFENINVANAYNYVDLSINGLREPYCSNVAFQFFEPADEFRTRNSKKRFLKLDSSGNYMNREQLVPVGNLIFVKHHQAYLSGQIEELEHKCADDAQKRLGLGKTQGLLCRGRDICQGEYEALSKVTAMHFFEIL